MRPLILFRPSERSTGRIRRLTASWRELATISVPIGDRGAVIARAGVTGQMMAKASSGLPDELAGLGQGGPLAVDTVLDLRIVGVVRGAGPRVGLASLIQAPAQHRRALP